MCIAFSINYLKTFEILNENPRIGPLISVWACFKENYKYVQLYRYEKKNTMLLFINKCQFFISLSDIIELIQWWTILHILNYSIKLLKLLVVIVINNCVYVHICTKKFKLDSDTNVLCKPLTLMITFQAKIEHTEKKQWSSNIIYCNSLLPLTYNSCMTEHFKLYINLLHYIIGTVSL